MHVWQVHRQELVFSGQGNQDLLALSPCAFLSSRQCPGTAIRAAMDWALARRQDRVPVVSGFHSPLELSVLKVLLQARCPVVAVLARPVSGARLAPDWAEPLAHGRLAVVSAATGTRRLTADLATERNDWVARLAGPIVVAHASPGGRLAALCDVWNSQGRIVQRLG
jgi:predicted Rossmann fold nucleotide-binding protein DprA/Smf involved in DNA uptake